MDPAKLYAQSWEFLRALLEGSVRMYAPTSLTPFAFRPRLRLLSDDLECERSHPRQDQLAPGLGAETQRELRRTQPGLSLSS